MQVAFLSQNWKKMSVWSSILFTVSALKIRKREAYRKQSMSHVFVLLNKVIIFIINVIIIILPTQPLLREAEDFPKSGKYFKHVPLLTYLIYILLKSNTWYVLFTC